MPKFRYTARSADGKAHTGLLDAIDEPAALKSLSERFDYVTSVKQSGPRRSSLLGSLFESDFSGEDLVAFTGQLAEMLESGLALNTALEIILADLEKPGQLLVVLNLLTLITGGASMSGAMRQHPTVFSRLYVTMVAAGEASGRLPLMLSRMAGYLQRTEAVKRHIRSALVYPAIVTSFAFVVVGLILIFGVPRISGMYDSMGAKLPTLTAAFIEFCTTTAHLWYVWVPLLCAVVYGGGRWLRTERGVSFRYGLATRTFGKLTQNIAMARFCRTLGTLYSSAVPLGDGLEMVATGMGQVSMQREVMDVRTRIMNGESLAQAMRRSTAFPPLMTGMVAAGQESGSLDRMLNKLAEMYEDKVDNGLKSLVNAFEPLVIIVVGLMVAATLIILGLPFLNLGSSLIGQ